MIPLALHKIYNDYGFTDLELTKTYKDSDGEVQFCKWRRFDELMKHDIDYSQFTERRIMDIEVVLDYDEFFCKKCYNLTSKTVCTYCGNEHTTIEQKELIIQFADLMMSQLRDHGYKYRAYFTGNKGVHVQLLFPQLRGYDKRSRESFKEDFIVKYHGERGKKGDKVMIMREGMPHRKTGVFKTLIFEVEGFNWIKEEKHSLI